MKVPQGKVKSPSIPLYKRGMFVKWFQKAPPFSKGGPGGILQEEGYTLIEILIAIAILAFGLMAVATMQVTAIKTNAVASGISQGLTLAQAKMEELMNLPYDQDLSDTDGDGTAGLNDTGDDSDNDPPDTHGRYTIYWNIAVNEPVTSSKTIRVIVTWTEKGRSKRIALDFIKTDLS